MIETLKNLIARVRNGRCLDIVGEDVGTPELTAHRSPSLLVTSPTLYWPFEYRPIYITQAFGSRHYGPDIGIPNGTKLYNPLPVRAQIVKLGWNNSGYGIMVGLKNDEYGYYVILAHMQRINPDLRVGMWIEPFEFVGWSDSTGNSTGPHLHLELRHGNGYYPYPSSCINPRPLLQWYSQAPSPIPPPKPNPSPPPVPTPNPPSGWYKVRTTQEIRLYTKQKANTIVNYPRIAAGYELNVADRKNINGTRWVILENGFFTIRRDNSRIYLKKI